jgi:hypothetical protein
MNRDFVELISAFNDAEVEYLIVGAHALAAHGHVRATKDLDVWVRPDPENAARAFRALAAFGAPLTELVESDLASPGTIFQIGVAPVRIDIVTAIMGSLSRKPGRRAWPPALAGCPWPSSLAST